VIPDISKEHNGQELFQGCLILGDEDTMIIQSVGTHLPSNTLSQPRRLESSRMMTFDMMQRSDCTVHAWTNI